MKYKLSDHFSYKGLLSFALPSIAMMIFTSVYSVVDGFFVSNFVGKTPFTAVNFIMPVLMILGSFGFMLGTGGTALISKHLGEGKTEKANRIFSMLIAVSLGLGCALAVFGFVFLPQIASWMGASENLLEDCVIYGRIIAVAVPAFMLQMEFQSFLIAAERPKMGLWITVASGICNMILDALFIAVFQWGLVGAALATAISQAVGGFIPLLYFLFPNKTRFRLGRFTFDGRALIKTCANGSSELMSNISMSLVGMLYNLQLLRYAGEDGVAAYGVMMYVMFVFISVFIGYTIGTAPIFGYHYGAQNHKELQSLRRKSTVIILIMSVAMTFCSLLLARPFSVIFVGYDQGLFAMTHRGFLIYSFSFLFSGFAIFSSAFFTSLNNGAVSALISFSRTILFQVSCVYLLPLIWGLDGVWYSVVAAELLAAVVAFMLILRLRKKYQY